MRLRKLTDTARNPIWVDLDKVEVIDEGHDAPIPYCLVQIAGCIHGLGMPAEDLARMVEE